jgi:hypothetical protein
MTRPQALELVGELMAAYRTGQQVAPETVEVYVTDILDLDYEPAVLAIKRLRQTRTFLPSIAEVRQAATEITAGQLPDGGQAWAEVTDQIRAVGYTGRPEFSHSAIAETVRALGWRELCASANQVADRAHFLKLYGTRRDRLERERNVDPEVNELAAALAERYALDRQEATPTRQLPARMPMVRSWSGSESWNPLRAHTEVSR